MPFSAMEMKSEVGSPEKKLKSKDTKDNLDQEIVEIGEHYLVKRLDDTWRKSSFFTPFTLQAVLVGQ